MLAALVLVVVWLTMAAACGDGSAPTAPTSPSPAAADITGIVWRVDAGAGGGGTLLVVGLQGAPGRYDRASVRLTDATVWWVRDEKATSAPSFRAMGARPAAAPVVDRQLIGRRVSVTFSGAVAESYPVQATAAAVALLEPLGVSMHVQPTIDSLPRVGGRCVEAGRDDQGRITSLTVLPDELPAAELDGGENGPIAADGSDVASPETQGGITAAVDVVRVTLRVTPHTRWLLDTPTEFKLSHPVLIGNGITPRVEVFTKGRTAVWVLIHLADAYAGA